MKEKHIRELAVINKTLERKSEDTKRGHQYYSVEMAIEGLDFSYQFRIWNVASTPMCVLVKEDSDILPRLKVGETLNMKYYPTGSIHPPEYWETAIRHITKNDHGRFKGHYLVSLEILHTRDWKNPLDSTQALPFSTS